MMTNYALAHELLETSGWIASHELRQGEGREHIDRLIRAVAHLRGNVEPIANIETLLRNDPWAAAIASHVRATLSHAAPSPAPAVDDETVKPAEIMAIASEYDEKVRGGCGRGDIDEELAERIADWFNARTLRRAPDTPSGEPTPATPPDTERREVRPDA